VKRKKEKERKRVGQLMVGVYGEKGKKNKKNGVCVKLKGCCVFCKTHSL
jgi:hypothetical protein